ncbi:hypothetical protein [Dyella sp. 333MFSha]|uniref:hypothetical protein n=1 Tax=Dyella sp. 333MFSha TaxID=1798240 RepID=UPI00115F8483|nr:hypothetical protein [Dyella sp. 333MFSha]
MREALERELSSLNPDGVPSMLQMILQSACLDLSCGVLIAQADEETVTGALLGAIAANAAWASRIESEGGQEITWLRYRKTKGYFDSESRTGVDFGLMISIGSNNHRLAVFQAKRPEALTPEVLNVHRVAPADGNLSEESQFERLVRYGHEVLNAIGRPAAPDDTQCLDWMHYLTYVEDGLPTYTVAQLDEIRKAYAGEQAQGVSGRASMQLEILTKAELAFLLTSGASEVLSPQFGWLSLSDRDSEAATGKLSRRMPMLEVALPGAPRPRNGRIPKDMVQEEFVKRGRARQALAEDWTKMRMPKQQASEDTDASNDSGAILTKKRKPK